jgi:hypothetical protein
MINELNEAIGAYRSKWETLVSARSGKAFFENLLPTAVGWKTVDLQDFENRFAELRDKSDQIHFAWMNERWIATFHLRDEQTAWGIQIIKLMQRRPRSTDATGLDHIDFLIPEGASTKIALGKESDIKWSEEKNGDFCKWISIWFAGTEAKLRSNTTFDVCASEMQAISKQVTGRG